MLQIDVNACITTKEVDGVPSNHQTMVEGLEKMKESTAFLLIFSMLELK